MSSTTPLLPRPPPVHKKTEHSMFLRVCHSPHFFIGQRTLLAFRGLLAVYMVGAFAAKMNYDFTIVHHGPNLLFGWRVLFELSSLSWLLLTVYQVIGFVWTYMHLYYPRLDSEPESTSKTIKQFLSPARVKPCTLNRFLFCFFYNGATVINPLVTFMHWAIIVPHEKIPFNDLFGHDEYESWVIINFFIVNSVITFFEIFFLSSLRCDQPISVHLVWGTVTGLVLTAWLYLGWWVTGEFIYFFLNFLLYRWQDIVAMVIAFLCLLETLFLINHLLLVARQTITKRRTRRRRPRLPR